MGSLRLWALWATGSTPASGGLCVFCKVVLVFGGRGAVGHLEGVTSSVTSPRWLAASAGSVHVMDGWARVCLGLLYVFVCPFGLGGCLAFLLWVLAGC